MYVLVTKQLLIMSVIAAGGFIFAKAFKTTENESKFLSKLLLYFINPCLIVNSFNVDFKSEKLFQLFAVIFLSALTVIISIVISNFVFSTKKDSEFNSINRIGSCFTNCGFVGIPLVRGAIGEDAVFFLMGYLVIFNLGLWTYGYFQISGGKVNFKKIIKNPNLIAIILGLTIFCLPFKLPEFISVPLSMISELNSAVAMILIGLLLSNFKLSDDSSKKDSGFFLRTAFFCFFRLILIPLVSLAVLIPFRILLKDFPEIQTIVYVILICSACPAATSVPGLACIFNKNTSYASVIVSVSSVLCILTLPIFTAISEFILQKF